MLRSILDPDLYLTLARDPRFEVSSSGGGTEIRLCAPHRWFTLGAGLVATGAVLALAIIDGPTIGQIASGVSFLAGFGAYANGWRIERRDSAALTELLEADNATRPRPFLLPIAGHHYSDELRRRLAEGREAFERRVQHTSLGTSGLDHHSHASEQVIEPRVSTGQVPNQFGKQHRTDGMDGQ